jgi:hypothetical protein
MDPKNVGVADARRPDRGNVFFLCVEPCAERRMMSTKHGTPLARLAESVAGFFGADFECSR